MRKKTIIGLMIACIATIGAGISMIPSRASETEDIVRVSNVFTKGENCIDIQDSTPFVAGKRQATGMIATGAGNSFTIHYKNKIPTELMTGEMTIAEISTNAGEGLDDIFAVEFILADTVDPTNYVGLYWRPAGGIYENNNTCYAIANYKGEYRARSSASSQSAMSGKEFGYACYSMSLEAKNTKFTSSAKFSMNYAEKQIGYYKTDFQKVLDFDDVKLVGYNTWKGFTNNEAYLSIVVYPRFEGKAQISIEKLFDVDVTGAIDERNQVQPSICYNYGALDKENMPYGAIGYEYTLPTARGFDWYYGSSEVEVNAVLSETAQEPVENFLFTPSKQGKYLMQYSASNQFQDTPKTESFPITVLDKVPQINIWAKSDERPVIDSYYTIPEFGIAGGLGKLGVDIEVSYGGDILDAKSGDTVLIDKAEYLMITATAYGDVGDPYQKQFIFNVVDRAQPFTIFGVPKYALKDNMLVLPQIKAYKSNLETSVTVNGQKLDSLSIPANMVTGDLQVVYSVKDGDKVYEKAFVVPIHAPEKREDYLLVKEGECNVSIVDGKGALLQFPTAQEKVEVEMPYAISMNECALNFSIDGYDAESVDVIFTDIKYADCTQFLRFTYKDNMSSYMQFNGKGELLVVDGCYGNADKAFSFIIDSYESVLMTMQEKVLVENFLLPSNAAYISFRVNGVKANGVNVYVKQVANQLLYGSNSTYICTPDSKMELMKDYYFGNIIKIPEMKLYDVLSTQINAFMEVVNPAGEVLYKGAAKALDIKAELYGFYQIKYYPTESAKKAIATYIYSVLDNLAPTVTLDAEISDTAKVGEKYTLPKITITDNFDTEVVSFVVCYNTQTGERTVLTDNSYSFNKAGNYQIQIVALDARGNMAIFTQEVTVHG